MSGCAVAHVTNYLPGFHTHAGGAEWAAWRTFQALAAEGLDTRVFTLPFDGPSPKQPERTAGAAPLTVTGLPVVEAPLPKSLRRYVEAVKWYSVQHDPLAMRAFARILDTDEIGAVHFYNAQFVTFGLLDLARRRGLPTAMTIYDYWLFCPLTTLVDRDNRICRRQHGPGCIHCLPPLFRLIQLVLLSRRRRLFSHLVSRIDRFLVLSQASRRLLEDFGIGSDRITVVPPPLNVADFAPGTTPIEPGLIVFAGWLQRRKGPDALLRAFQIVAERCPEAHLEIHGMPIKWEDAVAAEVRRCVADPRLAGRVKLFEKPDRARVQQRMREAHVLAIPEQWENMSPILLLEARLLGKLVVSSRIGGIPEFVDDGVDGLLFNWDDSADLARAIERGLRDRDLLERAHRLAPSRTRGTLDPPSVAARLAAFNQALLASDPTSRPARTQER